MWMEITVLKVLYGIALAIAAVTIVTILVATFGRSLSPAVKARWKDRFDRARQSVVEGFEKMKTWFTDLTAKKEEVD